MVVISDVSVCLYCNSLKVWKLVPISKAKVMNNTKSNEQSSCKGRENGDASTGSERPLKKARFAWQVKGKYHLKNETDESNKNLTRPTEPSTSESTFTSQSSTSTLGSAVKDYLIKQDYNKVDSAMNPDNSLFTPINSISKDHEQYPRYLSSYERPPNNLLRSNSCNNVKTVPMADNAEDQCIARWQARQVAKGCLDNTLNRVLETWTTDPLPAEEATSRFLALDFAEFINHLPGDNSVENEGILMAISAHGLQNPSSSSSNDASNTDTGSISGAHSFDIPSPLRSLSPIVSDNYSQLTINQQSEIEEASLSKQNWQSDDQDANDATPFAYFSEPSQSYDFYEENHQHSNTDSLDIDSHYDFMNAAVLYAIKSKGLTALGTEYG